ncbi:MAG: FTR1 family iron permease, partial [Mailhella sp.]|nr:FTR1 family iron permease [Mailhella sp.]
MKRFIVFFFVFLALCLASMGGANAANNTKKYNTWSEITDDMNAILTEACEVYASTKDAEKGKELVNHAYFDFYEVLGVERNVKNYVSGKRASQVEYQFAEVKRLMTEGKSIAQVRASFDKLNKMVKEDGMHLDGKDKSPWSVFFASLIILVREGVEAMLVVAAIAAYLVRSGNGALNKIVYGSSILAIIVSAALAYALQSFLSSGVFTGAQQEIMEGVTMLFAVVVLFCVSNWMISKAEAEAWKSYLNEKVASAVTKGSLWALGGAAFLAVFREGAETILFYQALLVESKGFMDMVWYGIAAAALCLVVLFVVIRYGTLKIPLRPFFIGTSILMYVMSVAFAGGGVKELQEGDV